MLHTYDALIVGAGPAGCAAAYDLARAGRNVLLLEKRNFPRHKACACGLTRKTLKALRYSVEPVLERACRDVVLQEAGPAFLRGRRTADKAREVRVRLRQPFCAMAVRERFDHFCLQQTLAKGASFQKIEAIVGLREYPGHVEVDVALPAGFTETYTAPVLIGADGSNGQTRRLAAGLRLGEQPLSRRDEETSVRLQTPVQTDTGARMAAAEGEILASAAPSASTQATTARLLLEPAWYARGFALETTVPYDLLPAALPAGDQPHDLVFDFAPVAGGYGWLFPKADHINIGVGGFVPQGTGGSAAAGAEGMQYETVTRALLDSYTREKLGLDLAAVPGAHVTGQYLGLGGHAYLPQGRVLLAGDAAGLVDPLTGEGIHSAIVSGQAAAAAVLEVIPASVASRRELPGSKSPAQPEKLPNITLSPSDAFSSGNSSPGTDDPASFFTVAQASRQSLQLALAYARYLQPLQETLAFSHRAARSFYREPERGFKVMRTPLLRNLVLKTYADGLPTTKLLTSLARRVA